MKRLSVKPLCSRLSSLIYRYQQYLTAQYRNDFQKIILFQIRSQRRREDKNDNPYEDMDDDNSSGSPSNSPAMNGESNSHADDVEDQGKDFAY